MNKKNAHASQPSTLPSRSKSPPPKPKLVNKLVSPAAHKKNAQLPTSAHTAYRN